MNTGNLRECSFPTEEVPVPSARTSRLLLVCFALPEEAVELEVSGFEVRTLLTGVGKVNAAFRLTEAVLRERPDFVLNVGTAGTLRHAVGDIVVSRRFVDRDYERLKLHGLACEAVTDGGALFPLLSSHSHTAGEAEELVVNTGDNFVVALEAFTGDVVDMEAYAEAVVCNTYGVPFVSVKCITDVVGQNSVEQWSERLATARRTLADFFSSVNVVEKASV